MKWIAAPYSRTFSLNQRRILIAAYAGSALLCQLFLPTVRTDDLSGFLTLLLIPIAVLCRMALLSEVWVWNRLFRANHTLDEYEQHARNTFIAKAYQLNRTLMWVSFAAFLIGGGQLKSLPVLNVFSEANFEVAVLVFVCVMLELFAGMPRMIAAWCENITDT